MPRIANSNLLSDILLFVKVVEKNSFTAAANELGISKSVVSKRITRLEKSLAAQLLKRSTRKLSLTETGQTFYDRCARIETDVEEAVLEVGYSHAEPRGTIRLTSPTSFGNLHLTAAIADYMVLHPEIKVELMLGGLFEDLFESSLDLAIRIGNLPDSNLIARKLTVRPMRVCAAPSYLQQHGIPKTPHDLLDHNCLMYYNAPTGADWVFATPHGEQRIKVSGNFLGSTGQSVEQAAVHGLGIAMLPGHMMTNAIKSGRLINLLAEYCPKNIGIYAVYPQTRHLAPKIRSFIDFLAERFEQESYWSPKPADAA